MRQIAVVTSGRADYGILFPVLKKIVTDSELQLRLMVTGMHLCPEFGLSETEIVRDGFIIADRIESLISSDTPEGTAKSMGLTMLGFSQAFTRSKPDLIIVVGDRFEIHACVSTAVPYRIPVAHIHGGEITTGAIDELFRHSISKMSHIHFASAQVHADRIAQMGEEPWRIHVTGAPGLDNVHGIELYSVSRLESEFEFSLNKTTALVTFHPTTLGNCDIANDVNPLLDVIKQTGIQAIFTSSNADSGGRAITDRIKGFTEEYASARVVANASQATYFSLMKHVDVMLGNSSSGLIEAPLFSLPVVNIGPRQDGRVRAKNVIDVDNDRAQLKGALKKALSSKFRNSLNGIENPYGDGNASAKIIDVIKSVPLCERLTVKQFKDVL